MARAKSTASSQEQLTQLKTAIDRLSDLVQVLTQAIDELTDEVQWRNNQHRDRPSLPPVHVTSMPLDPTAKDWQINRLTAQDLPPEPPKSALFE